VIVSELLDEVADRLAAMAGGAPSNEGRWIVEEAVGWSAGELLAHLDDAVTVTQMARFDQMVSRRLGGEPIQYVLGHWPFRGLDLMVDRRVLIPRPETEVLVDIALAELGRVEAGRSGRGRHAARLRVLDLGTGSGAIALSIAAERLDADVWAVERSADALAVARANLTGLGRAATRVRMIEGSWYDPLPDELAGTIHLVVSNPPYIDPRDSPDESVTAWEPPDALWGAGDGMGDIAVILEGALRWLVPSGSVVCEIDSRRGEACGELAGRLGYRDVAVEADLAGLPRVLRCRR